MASDPRNRRGRPGRYLRRALAARRTPLWRRLLPWVVSLAALGYVFQRLDWNAALQALEQADLAVFVVVTAADKIVFFIVWTYLQAIAVQRFVTPVPFRSVLAIRGGSELLRAVSNPLADAAFFLGLVRLTGGRLDAVLVAAFIPFVTHLFTLLLQASLALPFLPGGPAENQDVVTAVIIGWLLVASGAVALRVGSRSRIAGFRRFAGWVERIQLRRMAPFLGWFLFLAIFDIIIQGTASRAFGVPIAWIALAGRIPILYAALSIPSLGNFGVRELTWAALFDDFGSHDTLVAYALATNTLFLLLNVMIGVIFLPRALELVSEVRRARKSGEGVPEPLLHDAGDP